MRKLITGFLLSLLICSQAGAFGFWDFKGIEGSAAYPLQFNAVLLADLTARGTLTHTRASTATVEDYLGNDVVVKSGSPAFPGMRAVTNLLQNPTNLSGAGWSLGNTSGGASKSGNTLIFGASASDYLYQTVTLPPVGTVYVASFKLSGTGTIGVYQLDNGPHSPGDGHITLTSTPTIYTVPWTIADTANAGIWISNVDGQAKTITVEYIQLEDKTLRPNENASEFASATSWFNTTDSQPIVFWGDSMTARGYPEKTGAVLANVNAINKGVGGETSTQIKNRFLAAPRYNSALTVIWVGHNNAAGVGKQEEVEGDIQAIIAGLTGGANYLVLSLASGSSTDAGDGYTNITAINNWIISTYPNNHFPAKTFLQSHYDPNNAQDVIDIAEDRVPSSLRVDPTHLTPAADQMLAQAVASSLTAKGWASLGYNTITPGKGVLVEPASGASGATQPVVLTGTPLKPYAAGKQWTGTGKVTFNSLIAGDNYIWSSYVDANNYTALIVNGTSAIFRRRVGGSNKDATATITAPALGIQYDWKFRILASGAAEVTFGTVTASSSDTTAPQLAANSAFQLGSLNSANQISGLIQGVKVQ